MSNFFVNMDKFNQSTSKTSTFSACHANENETLAWMDVGYMVTYYNSSICTNAMVLILTTEK